ncbi:MAG: type IV pilus assembly protein PilM [Janthinobacterium lividum]
MAAGPLIGIDIGSQQIKIAELRPTKTGLTVTALALGPTPVGIIQNNIITDPAAMGSALKQLMRESGITIKRAVGCISGQNAVVIRIIEVPRMTDAELKETMKWEVERHVPFAPSETVLDYQPLTPRTPEAANGPNMEVLLAVAQQDAVSNYLDVLFAAGLDPIAIDIEPLAVARAILDLSNGQAVIRPQSPPGELAFDGILPETVAVVNIGAANTEIAIFQGDQLAFPRSLPLAGDSLTRAIAEALQYPVEQAERVKRDFGMVQLDRMAVYTGTAYDADGRYEAPEFTDEEHFNLGDDAQDNPFDLNPSADADFGSAFGTAFRSVPSGRLGEAGLDDVTRTQPMSRRTLNLARPAQSDVPPAFLPPSDDAFGLPSVGGMDENKLRDEIFEAIAPVLQELSAEIRRSLDYYRSRGAQVSVDRVLLTGGSAGLTNLAAFLQNELQTPVSVANALDGLAVTSKHFDPAYLQTIGPVFTIAVGLAARDVVFSANPLPKKPKPIKTSAKTAANPNVTASS